MKKNFISHITLCLIIIIFSSTELYSVKPYTSVNTNYDERSVAFRGYKLTEIETWKTISGKGKNKYSMALEKSNPGKIDSFQTVNELIREQISSADIILDGSPAFPYCSIYDDNIKWGVFVSNRLVDGKDYDNDIYEITFDGKSWSSSRINEVSSKHWDDTPALSKDGNYMFFSSNKDDVTSGKTDLFISSNQSGHWDNPIAASKINTKEFNELSPFIGIDGYLYFSSDRDGDYDIWRIKINSSCQPIGEVEKLNDIQFPDVNKVGSNEFSPCFSIGNNFFIFSSNRNSGDTTKSKTKDYDLYYIDYSNCNETSKDIIINLNVKQIKQDYTSPDARSKGLPIATENVCPAEIEIIRNMNPLKTEFVTTDPLGNYTLNTPRKSSDLPEQDISYREVLLKIKANCCKTSTNHTLKLDASTPCDSVFEYLINISCEEKAIDTIPFVIDTIPFFATGYWCPSTQVYHDKTLCSSIFDILDVCESPQPETFNPECERNEVFSYSIDPPMVTPVTIKSRLPGTACIDINEMRQLIKGELRIKNSISYTTAVDMQIQKLVKQMKEAMENTYVNLARKENRKIRIEVYGWTDWRPLDFSCKYTGSDINLNNSFVKIESQALLGGKLTYKDYIKDGIIKSGTKFVGKWKGGNQLLSDLRAYFMAVLLDKLWAENVYEYKNYKSNIEIVAMGQSIRDITGVSLAINRSVDVLIRLDQGKKVFTEIKAVLNPDVEKWLWKPECMK